MNRAGSSKKVNPMLTKDEVAKAFEKCDSTQCGFISIKRLKIVMRSMGYEPRQSEIDEMITQMQKNEAARAVSSDQFTLEELCYLLSDKLVDGDDGGSEIRSAFELFDINNKGFISFQDLKRVAKELGEDEVEDKDIWEMIHFADMTKRGKVTQEDFKLIMKKTKMY